MKPLVDEDAGLVSELALRSKSHWEYSPEERAVFQRELTLTADELKRRIAIGAWEDQKLRGFYTMLARRSDAMELEHVFVDPNHLYEGIGSRLVSHAIEQCRQLRASQLSILSDPHAAGFYERIGARLVDIVPSSIPGRTLPRFVIDIE